MSCSCRHFTCAPWVVGAGVGEGTRIALYTEPFKLKHLSRGLSCSLLADFYCRCSVSSVGRRDKGKSSTKKHYHLDVCVCVHWDSWSACVRCVAYMRRQRILLCSMSNASPWPVLCEHACVGELTWYVCACMLREWAHSNEPNAAQPLVNWDCLSDPGKAQV